MSGKKLYNDFGSWIRTKFPYKVQKISIDAGFSCPNRDGRVGVGGCIYCDNRTFNPSYCMGSTNITDHLNAGKQFFAANHCNACFSLLKAFTNTYASLDALKRMYEEALAVEDVVGLVIGTRPDCVSGELLDYLADLSRSVFVLVEYGIESANDDTLRLINRGHDFACVQRAVASTVGRGILCGGHIILGLPGEDDSEIIRQARLISSLSLDILKIHQMQIVRGTKLADMYAENPFRVFSVEAYIELLAEYIQHLRPSLVLERFVSQSPSDMLIAPKWGLKNYEFTNLLDNYLRKKGICQGAKAE